MEGHKRVEEDLQNEISPERELLAAVLARAKADLSLRYTEISSGNSDEYRIEAARELRWGAAYWINSNSPRPYGFVWICEHLGLDPETTRSFIFKGVTQNENETIVAYDVPAPNSYRAKPSADRLNYRQEQRRSLISERSGNISKIRPRERQQFSITRND